MHVALNPREGVRVVPEGFALIPAKVVVKRDKIGQFDRCPNQHIRFVFATTGTANWDFCNIPTRETHLEAGLVLPSHLSTDRATLGFLARPWVDTS